MFVALQVQLVALIPLYILARISRQLQSVRG